MPVAADASRNARLGSDIGVPPASFVITQARPCSRNHAPTRWICVDLPGPSGPSNVMNIRRQSVLEAAQVMLAHQRLEDLLAREQAKAFAEARFAPQLRELRFVREGARGELVDAEEVSELGMLLVEDCARLADGVLPPRERVDVHR